MQAISTYGQERLAHDTLVPFHCIKIERVPSPHGGHEVLLLLLRELLMVMMQQQARVARVQHECVQGHFLLAGILSRRRDCIFSRSKMLRTTAAVQM